MGINPNQINIVDNTGLSALEGSVIVSKNNGENSWSSNSTKSIVIPVGNSAQRDSLVSTGQLRVNTDLNVPEISIGGNWRTFSQLNPNGDQINPSISFINDTHTGMFLPQANQLGFTVSNSTRLLITPIQTSIYGAANITGTVTTSGIVFSSYPGNTVGLTVNRPVGQPVTLLYDDNTQSWTSSVRFKSSIAPTQNDDLANKAYVDNAISGGGIATTTSYGTVKLATQSQSNSGTAGLVATTDIALVTINSKIATALAPYWSSSNDGANSGLDADLLDGQHGSYYATASSLSSKVSKTGDTMTGALTLASNPTGNLDAAPKQYVDTKLPLAGGTLTGALMLASDPASALQAATKQYVDAKVSKSGDTMTGFLTLSANPTANLHAATKAYVDTAVGSAGMSASQILTNLKTVDGSGSGLDADLLDGQDSTYYTNIAARLGYTPVDKAGDSMTGLLTLSGNPTSNLHAATKQYVDGLTGADALMTKIQQVDGTGSGLDADLLDGLHASDFITSSNFGSSSIVQNGYQYLPNGLLIQWGRVYTNANSNGSGSFPITFPNACFAAVMNGSGELGNFGGQSCEPTIYTYTTSTFYWHSGDDNGCYATFIAIGY